MQVSDILKLAQNELSNRVKEEESAYATTDSSSMGDGTVTGVTMTDPSYMYRAPLGEVQTRPRTGKKKKKKATLN